MSNVSNIFVEPSGPDGSDILIIGEAPGSDETRLRQPFVGRAGDLLRTVLQNVGFHCAGSEECEVNGRSVRSANDGYSIKFANLCNYQPGNNNFEDLDGTIELKQGLEWLDNYIKTYKDRIKLVILLGNKPIQYILGKYGVSKWRGSVLVKDGVNYLCSYHPSFIARVKVEYPVFQMDMTKAYRIYKEGYTLPKYKLAINPDGYVLEDSLIEYGSSEILAVDIETVKNTNRIICCGVAKSRTEAICVANKSDMGLDPTFERFFRTLLEDEKIKKVFHNGLFDIEILHNNGIEVTNFVFDTQVAQHVMAPGIEKSLDFITSIYTDIPYYKDKGRAALPENEKGWGKLKDEDKLNVYEYNCLDCCATFWCYEEMHKEISADADWALIFPYEMSMHEVAIPMVRAGMYRDEERQKKLKEIVESKFIFQQKILNAITGESINTNSNPKKQKLLYETWGLPERTGEKGQVTADEDAIVSLIAYTKDYIEKLKTESVKYEWQKKLVGLSVILKLAGFSKLLGSYINAECHPDNRWRSSYKITGTETGRWSCALYFDKTGWNAQTLPRESIEE